jgi:hypothetical protein
MLSAPDLRWANSALTTFIRSNLLLNIFLERFLTAAKIQLKIKNKKLSRENSFSGRFPRGRRGGFRRIRKNGRRDGLPMLQLLFPDRLFLAYMTLIDTINDSGHEQDKDAIAGASGAGFEHAFERHFRIEKREDTKEIDEAGAHVSQGEEPGNTQIVVFRLFCIGNRTRIGTFIRTLSDSVPKIDGRKDHDAYDRINGDAPHEASRRAIFSGCGQKRYNHQNDVEISQSFEKHFQLGFVHGRFILNSLFGLASEIIAMAFYIGLNLGHWILK